MFTKKEQIKEIFKELQYADTDWSLAADLFIAWNIDKDFETESFANFVAWIEEETINDTWHFFFGYGEKFEKFAEDWVEENEVEDYLNYCQNRY